MYRIRFHGRGGQGMKTASRILGTAFFLNGFEVQDAPRYGAERRGAPIFAYVRAAKKTIYARGVIQHPDLVVVADDSLIPVPAAAVLAGIGAQTVLLISSYDSVETWRQRLNVQSPIVVLPLLQKVLVQDELDSTERRFSGTICAAAAASLTRVISQEILNQAIREELQGLSEPIIAKNIDKANAAFQLMQDQTISVSPGQELSATHYKRPTWVELNYEDVRISAPAIHGSLTSVEVKTGLWRTLRPQIDLTRCKHCWWICSTFCPDGAISVTAQSTPQIDYDHCKGCMICVAQCPTHAIEAIPEHEAQPLASVGGL